MQLGLAHHRRGDLATVSGRAGVVAAHGGLHLAQHPACLFGIFADHRQATAALAVEGEVLGKRVADEEADTGGHHGADGVGILFQSVTEALIGDIHKGDQVLLDHQRDHPIPLGAGEIHPGRVVAAGVQQHDALRRQAAQAVDHGIELHAASGRIVVGVVMHLDAGSLEHRLVVVPGGIADPHLGGREVALEQIGANLQRAGAADGLDGGDTSRLDRFMVGTKQQVLHCGAVVGGAFHRLVGARGRGGGALRFGLLHRRQQRNTPLLVVIEANPQVHLLLAGVFVEGLD